MLLLQSLLLEQPMSFRQFRFGLLTPLHQLFTLANALRRHLVLEPPLCEFVNVFRALQRGPFLIPLCRPGGFARRQVLLEIRSQPTQFLGERFTLLGETLFNAPLMFDALPQTHLRSPA